MRDLLLNFTNGKVSANQAIRSLSGIVDPVHAVSILAIICAITRVVDGDMDTDTFKSVFKLEEYEVENDPTN